MKTKRLVTDALCIALNIVLSNILALNLGPIKLSFSGFPIIVAAMMLGPVDGFLVGLLGGLVGQLIGPYGVSLTTPLWILPPAAVGLIVGAFAGYLTSDHKPSDKFSGKLYGVCGLIVSTFILFSALFVDTTLTTLAMYVDCLVYKYSFAVYSPYIVWRYVADLIKAPIYCALAPLVVHAVSSRKAMA